MDPADVAFFAGQTHPTPRASDVAFQSPRGRGGGYPAFKRGSRVFRGRGGGFWKQDCFQQQPKQG